ncbi:hypothetical protein MPER_12914 [Moniliophthora perniciosa FA553]|nr:hypothetical protein MPER_12914 [Moniliophthora perniciosa FA553]
MMRIFSKSSNDMDTPDAGRGKDAPPAGGGADLGEGIRLGLEAEEEDMTAKSSSSSNALGTGSDFISDKKSMSSEDRVMWRVEGLLPGEAVEEAGYCQGLLWWLSGRKKSEEAVGAEEEEEAMDVRMGETVVVGTVVGDVVLVAVVGDEISFETVCVPLIPVGLGEWMFRFPQVMFHFSPITTKGAGTAGSFFPTIFQPMDVTSLSSRTTSSLNLTDASQAVEPLLSRYLARGLCLEMRVRWTESVVFLYVHDLVNTERVKGKNS